MSVYDNELHIYIMTMFQKNKPKWKITLAKIAK